MVCLSVGTTKMWNDFNWNPCSAQMRTVEHLRDSYAEMYPDVSWNCIERYTFTLRGAQTIVFFWTFPSEWFACLWGQQRHWNDFNWKPCSAQMRTVEHLRDSYAELHPDVSWNCLERYTFTLRGTQMILFFGTFPFSLIVVC